MTAGNEQVSLIVTGSAQKFGQAVSSPFLCAEMTTKGANSLLTLNQKSDKIRLLSHFDLWQLAGHQTRG
jgi:hypothetical protein